MPKPPASSKPVPAPASDRPLRKRSYRKSSGSAVGLDLDCLPTLIGFNIRRAQIALWRDFNRNFSDADVRPGVFSAMLLANANPGIAQTDIANQLGIDKASVVSLIDRMEHAGWVERRRSTEDRRRQGIFLTAPGTKACRSLKRKCSTMNASSSAATPSRSCAC